MSGKPPLQIVDPSTQALRDSVVLTAVKAILKALDDPDREGLIDTPRRVAAMYAEIFDRKKPDLTCFPLNHDEMVIESGIPFYSLCEHHMLPFFGTADVAYLPNGRVLGLSKIGRVVQYCSSGFQMQERLTEDIASMIQNSDLKPWGCGVVLRARHLCMEMRGVKQQGSITTTSALRGSFALDSDQRAEFFSLIHGAKQR